MPRNVVSGMLRGGLYTRVVGRRIIYFQRLSSTMDEAARLAQDGTEDGTVVLAEEQTAGRGRFQRVWVSQAGDLHMSIVLRPPIQALPYLSILSGVAVVRAIRKTTGLRPTIKWPNDVRMGGKKVSGILIENALQGDSVRYAIVGIGVNIALDPSTVDSIAHIATSLNVEAGKAVDPEVVLRHLLQELDSLYVPLRQPSHQAPLLNPPNPPLAKGGEGGFPEARVRVAMEEWRGLLETLGKRVVVRWHDEVYTGYAEGVDEIGNLLLRLEDGTLATLPAGEVTSQMSAINGQLKADGG